MFCRSLSLRFVVVVLVAVATVARAVDPYQSRLDREYKSLSSAIARAYQPPPPRPSTPARPYSSPSYSSSSTSRSSSPSYSSSSSYSRPKNTESHGQTMNRFEQQKKSWETKYAESKGPPLVEGAASKAATARGARETYLNEPSHTPAGWARLLSDTQGKAPLAAPPRGALESRRTEFDYFLRISQARGAQALWENLRLGQLCLLFQGQGAAPSRAFGFFKQSNPAWPEVQLGLGLCYLRGYGVASDAGQARALLEKAAAFEPAEGLVVSYQGGGDAFQDIAYQACRELAVAYDLGQGLPADASLASDWYARAQNRRLYNRDYDEIRALKREFWQRHSRRARELLERDFAAAKNGGAAAASVSLFADLVGSGDAQALYEVGDFADTKTGQGDETATGRSGISYFLGAARLDHDAAARAYFSPAKNGVYNRDLDGDVFWKEHADFVRAKWPQWETKWLAAAQAGDAAANIPLAFYYSGGRGNPADRVRAARHAALMPAAMPAAQRAAIVAAIAWADTREKQAWVDTVWAKFGATYKTVDLTKLAAPADPARGEAWREAGIELARTDLNQARDYWRDAAALGDLPAQVQLFLYAARNGLYLGDYYKSLQVRLEAAANAGDPGAMAVLGVLMDGGYSNKLGMPSALYEIGQAWRDKAAQHAAQKARFLRVAEDPTLTDAHCAAARAAALRETESWQMQARKWGLTGHNVIRELTVSAEELRTVDGMRAQFLALAAAARQLEGQLALWEKSVERRDYEPEADARFIQGYEAWLGNDESEHDLALAVDYFSQSTGLGQPVAPLTLAYFFGSGFGGFPVNADISRRFRALSEARLTAMAEADDRWAQTILGDLLLTDRSPRENDLKRPGAYEWLPQDKARGMKWLHAAAADGSVLPRNFGDASGQTVAWFLSQRYYDQENKPAYCKWKLIDEVFRWGDGENELSPATWAKAIAVAREIIAESPEAERARVALDQAVDDAENPELRAAALGRRALARSAAQLDTMAIVDAELAANLAAHRAEAWKILARVQQSGGKNAAAAVSLSLAQALDNDVTAPARFEAAFAKIEPEKQENIREHLSDALDDHPESAALKTLKAIAVKIAPRK